MLLYSNVPAPTYQQLVQLFTNHGVYLSGGTWEIRDYDDDRYGIIDDININYNKPQLQRLFQSRRPKIENRYKSVLEYYDMFVHEALNELATAIYDEMDESGQEYTPVEVAEQIEMLYREAISYIHSDVIPTPAAGPTSIVTITKQELKEVKEKAKKKNKHWKEKW